MKKEKNLSLSLLCVLSFDGLAAQATVPAHRTEKERENADSTLLAEIFQRLGSFRAPISFKIDKMFEKSQNFQFFGRNSILSILNGSIRD